MKQRQTLSNADRTYLEAAAGAVGGTFISDPDRPGSAAEIVFDDEIAFGEHTGGEPEALIWLRFYHEGGERRVRAISVFPSSHRVYWFERSHRTEITVAVRRGPEALAAALRRRLLPGHRKDLARFREALRRDDRRRTHVRATARRIARAAGLDELPESMPDPYEVALSAYEGFGDKTVVRLRCMAESVQVKSSGLDPDVAEAMLRAGREAAVHPSSP